MGYAEKMPVAGSYKMGNDGALTLITEYETMSSEERLWFASPNLRMRVGVLKRFLGVLVWLPLLPKFVWVLRLHLKQLWSKLIKLIKN